MNVVVPDYPDYVDAACQAVASGRDDALESLGWWELLGDTSDLDIRAAIYSVFEAEGREVGSTGALAAVAAAPYAQAGGVDDLNPRSVAIVDPTATGGPGSLVLKSAEKGRLLRDVAGVGLFLDDVEDVRWASAPGALDVGRAVASSLTEPVRTEDDALGAVRRQSVAATQLALAFSLVGVGRTLLAGALAYAEERQQFGQPIGRFQAVRHLVATMMVEVEAASDVCQIALAEVPETPEAYELASTAKALAGRSALRVSQHALQVFGATGFTWEHPHSQQQRRVLVLDALYGSAATLTAALGRSTTRASLVGFPQRLRTTRG